MQTSTTAANTSAFPQSCHATLSSPHVGAITCVRFSHGVGEYLVSAGVDRSIVLWHPFKSKHIKTYPLQHGREVHDVQLSSTNEKFASGSSDKLALLWDVESGEVLRRFRAHTGAVNTLHFNEDDSILATGSYDASVKLWDVRSFSRDAIQTMRDARDSVSCVRIRGTEILAASMDGFIRRYDIRSASVTSDCMGVPVSHVAWSHDGECLLASCLDSTRKLIDKSNGQLLNTYSALATKYAMEACFDNTDGFVVGGGEDGIIRVWDLISAQEVHRYEGAHDDKPVTSVAWHPKKKQFASAGADGRIRFWV